MSQGLFELEVRGVKQDLFLCVDFSFCCITFKAINFSLEQTMLVVSIQAFILY